jgi:hypothetical protein
LLTHTVST